MSSLAFAAAAPGTLTTSFRGSACVSRHAQPLARVVPAKRATLRMGAPHIVAHKIAKVEAVKERLATAQMIFSIPLAGLKVIDVSNFKKALPEGSSSMTVKNTLMRRAIEESQWDVAGSLTSESSIWVFVGEDIKGTVEAYNTFADPLKRDPIKGGVMEGVLYDTAGINAIAALPSKKELIEEFARLVKMVPTKVARSVKEVPTKLARAIKLAIADEGDGDAAEARAPEAAAVEA